MAAKKDLIRKEREAAEIVRRFGVRRCQIVGEYSDEFGHRYAKPSAEPLLEVLTGKGYRRPRYPLTE